MSEYIGSYELGDVFKCVCGKRRKLEGEHLERRWKERVSFECDCGRVYHMRSGEVRFIEQARRAWK